MSQDCQIAAGVMFIHVWRLCKEESEQAAPQPKPAQPERRRSVQISDMKDSTEAVKSCFLNQCNWGYNTQNWTFSRNIWGWGKMGPTFKAGPKDVLSLF